MRVLVTGGAGFIGANLAVGLTGRHPDWNVVALDNLRRRGAELNLPRLREAGVEFVHGDIRLLDDLLTASDQSFDVVIECSAEPSVLAGIDGTPDYVIQSNLLGAYHCLELARRHGAYVLFLSTSRVYPVAELERLAYEEGDTRFELTSGQPMAGASPAGISEEFPLHGARTLYGATKLAAELLIEEYRAAYGLRAVVDRCGVIAGPWQMGKVDQGVFTYWMLAHYFNRPLRYIGFGGSGKQVRDLLHVEDLLELIDEQAGAPDRWDGLTVNVGGGRATGSSPSEPARSGRATCRSTCRIAPGSSASPNGVPATPRAGCSRTSTRGSRPTSERSPPPCKHADRTLTIPVGTRPSAVLSSTMRTVAAGP
jgi:CDP-paratose 2-epimerase